MSPLEKALNPLLIIGLLTIVAMALLPLLDINEQWMRWVFAAGAGMVLMVRLLQRYDGNNLRIRRLYRINIISALLFCASAGMTFYRSGTTDWIAFLMAGAALMLYVSFAIDHEQRRQEQLTGQD